MRRRIIALIIVTVFILSASFVTGCRQTGNETVQTTTTTRATTAATTAGTTTSVPETTEEAGLDPNAGTFPITTGGESISILVGYSPSIDWETNMQTLYIEGKTGIKLNFRTYPTGADGLQSVKLMFASNDYPDVISQTPGFKNYEIFDLAKQGIVLPLNEYIEKWGFEYQKTIEYAPYILELVQAPDGNIYTFPYMNELYHGYVFQRMFLYRPWLNELGLQMPTTTDELYTTLKAFRDGDPNKNGVADEIPLAGTITNHAAPQAFLMNAFIYYSVNDEFYLTDAGEVIIPYDKPEWRKGIEYMRMLYSEGLLAAESFTQTDVQLRTTVQTDPPVVGGMVGRFHFSYTGFGDGEFLNMFTDYEAVLPLKGPDGYQGIPWRPYTSSHGIRWMVTDRCANPEIAFRLGDYMLSDEMTKWSLWGPEDILWEKAGPNDVGLDGRPAKMKIISNPDITNAFWQAAGPIQARLDIRNSLAAEGGDKNLEIALYNRTSIYEPYKVDVKNVIPLLYFDDDQVTKLADLAQIKTFVNESLARFVTGDLDINTQWDRYVDDLNRMGFKDYVKIYQDAYNTVAR